MNYGGFGTPRRKKKTWLVVVAWILGICVVGLYVLGIILGSDSEDRLAISEAIEENLVLREELESKDAEIKELRERIAELESKEEDEEEVEEVAEETPATQQTSPRE